MKKLTSLLLAVLILISAFSAAIIPVSAAFTVSNNLTVTNSSYKNDEITYTIKLKKGVTKLTGAIIKAVYDPEVVKVVSCSGNSKGVPGVYALGQDASNAGKYSMAYINASGYTIGADTTFFTIKFKTISASRPKTTIRFACVEFLTEDGSSNDLQKPSSSQTIRSHTFFTLVRPTTTVDSVVSSGKYAIKVQWNASTGATGYDVYKKKAGASSWSLLKGDLTGTSYTDYNITKGVEYCYVVAAKNSYGTTHRSDLTGVAGMNFGTIEKISAAPISNGIRVKWSALNGAESYSVLRKLKTDTSWKVIAKNVKTTQYDDKSAASGVYYNYTVKAYKGKYSADTSATNPTACYIAAPKATVTNTTSGVKVGITAVGGATKYVLKRETVGGSTVTLATIASSSFKSGQYTYLDKTAKAKAKYVYSVYATKDSIKSSTRKCSELTRIATPRITARKNVNEGISVKWDAVSGATKYCIYRKVAGASAFSYYKTVKNTSFVDTSVTNGKTYSYSIAAMNSTGSGAYHSEGVTIKRINTPTGVSATSHAKGVQVKWNAVSGAEKYSVYRKPATGSGSYKLVGTTTKTSFVDTKASANTQYRYSVRANIGSYQSYLGASSVGMRFGTISTLKATYLDAGVKLTWNKLSNAKGYKIYRKTANDSKYTKIATVTSGNIFRDTSIPSGVVCYYKVEAYNGSCVAPMTASVLKVKFLAKPTISVKSTGVNKVTVKISSVYGADKYVLQRATVKNNKVSDYKTIAKIAKGKTSYVDTTVKAGVTYKYKVKAVSGNFSSAYSAATIKKVAPPKLTSCFNEVSGVQLKWSKVSGATSYVVYRKAPSSSTWTKLKTVSKTEYIDTTAAANKVYQYTVEAKISTGVTGYNSTKECRFIATPELESVENAVGGVQVMWKKVSGATSYRIYRRSAGSDSWTYLGSVSSSKRVFVDKSGSKKPVSGNYYRYTVRASYEGKDSKGKAYTIYSGFDTDGLYIKYVAAPKLTGVENQTRGINVTWKAVNGGGKTFYRVYRCKDGSDKWSYLGATEKTSYMDTGVLFSKGTTFRYTVIAVAGNDADNGWFSAFDKKGLAIKRQ